MRDYRKPAVTMEEMLARIEENASFAMKDIDRCVVCGKYLAEDRVHTDTCSETCFKRVLQVQRSVP